MIIWKRCLALCGIACLIALSLSLNAKQSAGDDAALTALLEKRYITYINALHACDVATLRTVALADMRIEMRGSVQKPVEELATLLADPIANKDTIARRKQTNASLLSQKYSLSSLSVRGPDASSVVVAVSHVTFRSQGTETITTSVHVDWRKVGSDWKIAAIHDPAVTVEQARPPRQPGSQPKWAIAFTKAVTLIGKSKAQIVEMFGPPIDADERRYRYVLDSQRRYGRGRKQVNDPVTTISALQTTDLVFILENGRVTDLMINFHTASDVIEVFPTMEQVWDAIDAPAIKPATLQVDDSELTKYWLHQAHSFLPDPHSTKFDIYFHGNLNGSIPVEITAQSPVPPVQGASRFDLTTNSYVIDTFVSNPSFSWRSTSVFSIETHNREQSVHPLNSGPWKEYPITP